MEDTPSEDTPVGKLNPGDSVKIPATAVPAESQMPYPVLGKFPRRYFSPAFREEILRKTKSEILECAPRYQISPTILWERARSWKSRYRGLIHTESGVRNEKSAHGAAGGMEGHSNRRFNPPWRADLLEMAGRIHPPGSALSAVVAERGPGCLSLGLLWTVHRARAGRRHPLHDRFSHLPLPILQGCLSRLVRGRDVWHQRVLRPAGRAVAETQARLWVQQLNLLLWDIALWQRRHPLGVVTLVLEQYRSGQLDSAASAACLPRGSHVGLLRSVLEAITDALYPGLSAIPTLIRCDVFMTYPHMPIHEQMAFMNELTNRCYQKGLKTRAPSELPGPALGVCDQSGSDEVPPGVQGSKEAINPKELLCDYIAKEKIPDLLITTELTDADYRALRLALERHKKDGVRRIAAESYPVYVG